MRYVKIVSDGITFEVWKEADHDTRLKIHEGEGAHDMGEPYILSHDACFILGIALQSIDEHDMEDESEGLGSGENTH